MKKTKTQKILERLEQGVQEVFAGEQYQEWLNTLSRFHSYSANNIMLIFLQKRDATRVAGYRTWQSMGRNVKKGEKAIQILAPLIRTEEDEETGEKRKVLCGFRYVNVFDISQTEGEPLPSLTTVLTTDTKTHYLEVLEALAERENIKVVYEPMRANGSYSSKEKCIRIKDSLAPDHQLKTFMHELAHHYTLTQAENYDMGEVIAESVAYVVSSYIGLDTSDYSFGYIAGWSGSCGTDILKRVAGLVQKTANTLITELEKETQEGKRSA